MGDLIYVFAALGVMVFIVVASNFIVFAAETFWALIKHFWPDR